LLPSNASKYNWSSMYMQDPLTVVTSRSPGSSVCMCRIQAVKCQLLSRSVSLQMSNISGSWMRLRILP
jgi:hypothetical protein